MGNRMILDELIFGHCGTVAEEAGAVVIIGDVLCCVLQSR